MAVFVTGYHITGIEVSKNYSMKIWREDIKDILMSAGIK